MTSQSINHKTHTHTKKKSTQEYNTNKSIHTVHEWRNIHNYRYGTKPLASFHITQNAYITIHIYIYIYNNGYQYIHNNTVNTWSLQIPVEGMVFCHWATYPLVISQQLAIENCHRNSGFSHENGNFPQGTVKLAEGKSHC